MVRLQFGGQDAPPCRGFDNAHDAFAMEGERLASGNAHADNVAPALLGGFTLVKSYYPLEVLSLPSPEELNVVILHPQIEVKTKDSRAIIKRNIE